MIYRHFTLISVFLAQLSLGKRRHSGSTLTKWRIMRDSNVWHTVCCKCPRLKSQECFRGILLCGCRKLGRQGHLRGSMTRGPAYVGNNLSSGIESNWRYMRRDVAGCAGATQRISLEVFTQSLIQYLSIRSKNCADKI
jgi:hypothetical protein